MIGRLFTPGRRWFQLFDLALRIIEDLQRPRAERGKHQ